MRPMIGAIVLTLCRLTLAQECIDGSCLPPSVLVQSVQATAQAHAEQLAATGGFYHARVRVREGIGFSTSSPSDAVRRCCYWGKYRASDIGTAWCPRRRGWVAVVRYH